MEEVGFYCSRGIVLEYLGRCNLTNLNADISDPTELMEAKKGVITRLIGVMMPILDVYQLPLTRIHIFYDPDGGPITFNRNGSIFVNLRYYEVWRTCHFLCLLRPPMLTRI